MKKPDHQIPKKEDPLKHNNNTEKITAEIEARVIKFGQKYIDRLIELAEKRMSGIREKDAITSSIDTFVLFGNPDLDFLIYFAETWKKIASKGKNPRIVLAGGTGRGTPPLIERVIDKYTDISDEEKNFLLAPKRKEAEIMLFVLNKEGIDSESYKNAEIKIEKKSENTMELLYSKPKFMTSTKKSAICAFYECKHEIRSYYLYGSNLGNLRKSTGTTHS